jgi:polar amino acid transport system permease protein
MLDDLDWSLVLENPGRGMLLSGLWITIQLTIYGTILSTIIGTLIALGRITRAPILAPLRWVLAFYVEFFRNVPLVVQLAFWSFGMFSLDLVRGAASLASGLYSNQFLAGLCGLTVYTSAYIAEVQRSGFQSVPKGQLEAARASGLAYPSAMRYVIIPQVFRRVLPALGNQYVGLTKNTTVVMFIGAAGILFQAQQIEATTFHAFEPFMAVVVVFVLLCWGEAALLATISRRLTRQKVSRSEIVVQDKGLEQV